MAYYMDNRINSTSKQWFQIRTSSSGCPCILPFFLRG